MRDHDQRALIARQLLLQPLDHLVVQVVGRLIQDQKIAGREQCRCQCGPFALSSGQRFRHSGSVLNPELLQHCVRFSLHVPELLVLLDILHHVFQNRAL